MNRAAARAAALAVTLLTLSGCGDTADRTQTIDIEHSRFSPSSLTFAAGTTVRFVVRNTDPIDHELIIGNETVQDAHELGTEAEHGDKPGEVTIPAGEERETTYTFTSPGKLIFGCHLPQHYAYGMRGTITVR